MNKYVLQMLHPQLLDVHLWGKYVNMYAMEEVNVIKTVVCKKGHRQTGQQSMTA